MIGTEMIDGKRNGRDKIRKEMFSKVRKEIHGILKVEREILDKEWT